MSSAKHDSAAAAALWLYLCWWTGRTHATARHAASGGNVSKRRRGWLHNVQPRLARQRAPPLNTHTAASAAAGTRQDTAAPHDPTAATHHEAVMERGRVRDTQRREPQHATYSR